MQFVTQDNLNELLSFTGKPCISLYQPTHRHHPDNAQDPIRFKNLVKQIEESLLREHQPENIAKLMEPFHELEHNTEFWNHTTDGLAIFAGENLFRVYHLQRATTELALAADSFHLKPIKKYLQSVDRFHILSINRERITLFEGNRDNLDEITLHPDVPATLEEALGADLTEEHLTAASYNGPKYATPNMYHGHGGKKDEVDVDTERFFRVIDRAIDTHYSKPTGLPLVLAALTEYHALFHQVSHNKFLVKNGIKINPKALERDQLREEAWKVFEPEYLQNLKNLAEQFQLASAKDTGSDTVREIAKAAAAGKVAILLSEENKIIPGRIIDETGKTKTDDQVDPTVDDLLDDLGELVIKMGGKVVIIPAEHMPTKTGVAAIYRY